MPNLPITFKDLQNLDIPSQVAAQGKQSPEMPQVDPQAFLANAVDGVKERFGTTEGLIDTGLAINPLTRYADMASKFFGGPGLAEGFKDGITQETGTRREIVLPPMPF
tara:strand:+ start:6006 stop:6329 length:324 start_codon:yes stop_codon:yes gene_type:complete